MNIRRFELYRKDLFPLMLSVMFFVITCSREKSPEISAHPETEEMVDVLFKARSIPELVPPLTKAYDSISIEQAYLIQDQLAEKLTDLLGPVNGYKIGFASESAFEKLGISEPACGRLYNDQIKEDGDTISVDDFFLFNIEAEVAFMVGKRIDKPLKDVQKLKDYIQSVHASFDISNNWYDMTKGDQTVADFVANSGGSHYFVLGPPVDPNEVDLDNLVLKILRDGENIYEGHSTEVFGGPWNIMKWISNHELKRGYPLEPGYVIFTGKVAPAFKTSGEKAKGTYIGDCGDLGEITVTLK